MFCQEGSVWFILHLSPANSNASGNSWSESKSMLLFGVATSFDCRIFFIIKVSCFVVSFSCVVLCFWIITSCTLVFETSMCINEKLKMSVMMDEYIVDILDKAAEHHLAFGTKLHVVDTLTRCILSFDSCTVPMFLFFFNFVVSIDIICQFSNLLFPRFPEGMNYVSHKLVVSNLLEVRTLMCNFNFPYPELTHQNCLR